MSSKNLYIGVTMITYLAIAFVIFLLACAVYGFSIVMRRPPTEEELQTEVCSICRKRFEKNSLVEREIGDYKLYYFCHTCIAGLYDDMKEKTSPSVLATKKLIAGIEGKRSLN